MDNQPSLSRNTNNDSNQEVKAVADALVRFIHQLGSVAVAFSAGVDSAVVAKGAQLALNENAVAITGVGPALAEGELEEASNVAQFIGIRHLTVATEEIDNPLYVANQGDRCYHCKIVLYEHARKEANQLGVEHLLNGANADDASDYRPGMKAASEHQVHSPLLELGIDKSMVRQLAQHWGLPIWNKPASPCLASRLAYGQQVTPERLAMVDAAERFIKSLKLNGNSPRQIRVRYLDNQHASVEVEEEWIDHLLEGPARDLVNKKLHALGFKRVTIDPQGFRSGNLNHMIL